MIYIFTFFTIILSIHLLRPFKELNFLKSNSSIFIIQSIFIVLYVLPLSLDLILPPDYSINQIRGFMTPYNDNSNKLYYLFLISISLIIFIQLNYKAYKFKEIHNVKNFLLTKNSKLIQIIFTITSFIAPFLIIILPFDKSILYNIGWRESNLIELNKYYASIEKITYMGTFSSMYLFVNYKRLTPKLMSIFLLYFNMNIQGKRSILIFFFLLVFAYFFYKGKISFFRFFIYGLFGLTLIATLGIFVKIFSRGYSDFIDIYTTLRIDIFRADRVLLVLYEIIENKRILFSSPGETFFYQMGSLFPLQFLGFTVVGFNSYLTSYLSNLPHDPVINWMTPSILDEYAANFGFISFIVVPLLLFFSARFLDQVSSLWVKILGFMALFLFIFYPFQYIAWFGQFFIIILIISNLSKKNKLTSFYCR